MNTHYVIKNGLTCILLWRNPNFWLRHSSSWNRKNSKLVIVYKMCIGCYDGESHKLSCVGSSNTWLRFSLRLSLIWGRSSSNLWICNYRQNLNHFWYKKNDNCKRKKITRTHGAYCTFIRECLCIRTVLNQMMRCSRKKKTVSKPKVAYYFIGIHVKDGTGLLKTCWYSFSYHWGILNYLFLCYHKRVLCNTLFSMVCSLVSMPLLITVMGIVLGLGRTEKKNNRHQKGALCSLPN